MKNLSSKILNHLETQNFIKPNLCQIKAAEKIDKNLLRYLTIRVKKIDLETNYFEKSSEEKENKDIILRNPCFLFGLKFLTAISLSV